MEHSKPRFTWTAYTGYNTGSPYAGLGVIRRRWRNSLPREGPSARRRLNAQQLMIMVTKAATWDEAEPHLLEAIRTLRSLNDVGWEGDTYPIVSLAEGHVSVFLRFHGLEAAKDLARQYGNELLAARRRNPNNERLEEAVTNVVTFATTGVWNEGNQSDYLEQEYYRVMPRL